MRLLIQPGDGVKPLIRAISQAKTCIEIVIFRFDNREIERALAAAVNRGIPVSALIAHTNRSGEATLRRLELRLLGYGVTVARTADDLVRYHGKMMLVDRRELFVLAFNFTHQDIDRSRSFGLVTRSRDLVREAGRLFDADVKRQPYEPGSRKFIVSPVNARKELAVFLKGAKKELLIYDPDLSDPAMIEILEARAKAGVDVRIIGKLRAGRSPLQARRLAMRLHTRAIIRDGSAAFIGSQSLRTLELDSRREVGMLFRDARIVHRLEEIFRRDWENKEAAPVEEAGPPPIAKVAKKVAKTLAQELPPVAQVLDELTRQVVGPILIDRDEVEGLVKDAVKEAVREAVEDVVHEAVQKKAGAT